MTDTRPIIIAIMGPTASGKTAAALDIAQKIPSEIISVDSALVYREIYIFRNGFSVIPPNRHRKSGQAFPIT